MGWKILGKKRTLLGEPRLSLALGPRGEGGALRSGLGTGCSLHSHMDPCSQKCPVLGSHLPEILHFTFGCIFLREALWTMAHTLGL